MSRASVPGLGCCRPLRDRGVGGRPVGDRGVCDKSLVASTRIWIERRAWGLECAIQTVWVCGYGGWKNFGGIDTDR